MVTAGVYLVARSAPLYVLVPQAQNIVALVGGLTALFAATIAVGQFDIKKVLAYSTISQLGFMVAAVGMGAFVAGMFHLVTHAFFKALLFLSAGSVIQGVEHGHHHVEHDPKLKKKLKPGEEFDPQDMRNMGGLRKQLPWTFWTYIMGTLALAGIPIWAGFWSKDEILLDASHFSPVIYWTLVAAAFLTAFYMGRQIWLVFFGENRTHAAEEAKESPWTMIVPLVALATLSVLGGFMNWPFEGGHQFGHWLGYTLEESTGHALHVPEFSWAVAGASTALALIAISISWLIYGRKPLQAGQQDPLEKVLGGIFTGMHNKWYIDEIYDTLILTPYQKFAKFCAETLDWDLWHDWLHEKVIRDNFQRLVRFLADPVDLGAIDWAANKLADIAHSSAARLSRLQTGFVRNYALSVMVGVVVILGYLIFR
jgi:NADH-quinone oxidoreductase subunit L